MRSTARILSASLAWLCLVRFALGDSRQCYFPDHSQAVNFTECNAAATQSSCCRNSEACLSNGYCLQQVGLANRITRGACTDSTFSNAACPSQCTDVAPGNSMSFFLAYDEEPNGLFCCYPGFNSTSQQCELASDGSGTISPFELAEGTVIIDRSNGATLSINTTADSTSTSTVTVTAESKSDGNVTAVGAGVGVSLGVLLVAALIGCGVLYGQLRKAKKQIQGNGMMMDSSNQYNGPKSPHDNPAFSPTTGTQSVYSEAASKPYNYAAPPQHPPAAPVESPFNNVIVEAPTDREVAMADSRAVGKPAL